MAGHRPTELTDPAVATVAVAVFLKDVGRKKTSKRTKDGLWILLRGTKSIQPNLSPARVYRECKCLPPSQLCSGLGLCDRRQERHCEYFVLCLS
mmetsp:Transcript_107974/g.220454  ORF Transcript_107974/g.220454 Transcript_107974/m.220454 type:complete len:94 (+) Transcript_107974:93-374(+)